MLSNNNIKKDNSLYKVFAKQVYLQLICAIFCVGFILPANARIVSQEPDLASHNLRCDQIFSCPEEIKRRVDFWISVFRLWNKQNRVLHDSNKPERVYMVLDTKDECSRKRPKGEVKKALNTVKSRLNSYAKLIKNGASQQTLQSHRYYKLFPNANLKEVLDARNSIRCQSGNKDLFTQALINYEQYQPYISKALIDQKLPLDIQYLPFVESSYNPKAYSYAGAAGMWQIMPRTARSLGLQVGSAVDERFEPEYATLAAAKYFRDSIDRLTKVAQEGNHSTAPADLNPFVVTSYNYGVRGMQRAIAQVGTDYVRLLNEYKSRSFQIAVKNFYASFLAARYVAQNKHVYFPNLVIRANRPIVDRIAMPKPLLVKNVLSALKISKKEFKRLNPGMTYRAWRNLSAIPTGFIIKVPYKSNGWKAETTRMKKMRSHTSGRGDSGVRHKVRSGQTACGIARRYKVRCKDLIAINKLGRKAVIRVGQRLKIPGGVQKYRKTNIVKASQELRKQLNAQNIVLANQLAQPVAVANIASAAANTTPLENPKQDIHQSINQTANKQIANSRLSSTTILLSSQNQPVESMNQSDPIDKASRVVNLETTVFESNGRFWVKVLPSETLGLYADWLSTGSTRSVRNLNRLKGKANVQVLQRIYLPIKTKQQRDDFVLNRNEYHLNIQLQYFQRFKVISVNHYKAKTGETLWSLSRKNNIPMWLLMQYNSSIRVGSRIKIPEVKKRV